MVKPTYLRWLSHQGAVDAVLSSMTSLLLFFLGGEKDLYVTIIGSLIACIKHCSSIPFQYYSLSFRDAKAQGIGNLMASVYFQATIRLFADTLPQLTKYAILYSC